MNRKIAVKKPSPKEMSAYFAHLSRKLTHWFSKNARDLPWRKKSNGKNRDPYRVWVSEIMLQQTRVDTVIGYYERFMLRFPDVQSLAEASVDEVLSLWSGLGYYSRGRNLHKAAQQIMSDFKGEFPSSHSDLLSLAGVGSYTSAAVGSFAFGLPLAVVDGNVHRVLARLFDIELEVNTPAGHAAVEEKMKELLKAADEKSALNEGIMELGALVCTPRKPACSECPFADFCKAHKNETIEIRPLKKKKTPRKKVFWVAVNVLFVDESENIRSENYGQKKELWVEKNTKKRLFGGLYGPMAQEIEGYENAKETAKGLLEQRGISLVKESLEPLLGPILVKRVLTHRELHVQVFTLKIFDKKNKEKPAFLQKNGCWYSFDKKTEVGVSSAATAMLATAFSDFEPSDLPVQKK